MVYECACSIPPSVVALVFRITLSLSLAPVLSQSHERDKRLRVAIHATIDWDLINRHVTVKLKCYIRMTITSICQSSLKWPLKIRSAFATQC